MGGEGAIAGMIISLKNNKNLRLKRKRFLSKESRSNLTSYRKKKLTYKHLSKKELDLVKKDVNYNLKKFRQKQVIALIISVAISTIIIALLVIYSDRIYEIIRSAYLDFLEPKDW